LRLLDGLDGIAALGPDRLFESKARLRDSFNRRKWARFQHASLAVEYRVRLFV
jgi:hypothetical protein